MPKKVVVSVDKWKHNKDLIFADAYNKMVSAKIDKHLKNVWILGAV